MKTIFAKFTITLALVLVVFGAVGYVTTTNVFINEAQAVVGGSGGCGDCGDTTSGGSSDSGSDYVPPPVTPVCKLSIDKTEVTAIGESYRLTWSGTPSSATFFINGTQVPDSGWATYSFVGPNYERFHMVGNNDGVTCDAEVRIIMHVTEPPVCNAFTANPTTLPVGGGDVTLAWDTTDATTASIDGQSVAGDGSMVVKNVTSSRTFTLTVNNVAGSDTCTAKVTVPTPTPLPTCDSFTANPTALPVGGGNTTLTWATTNATSVKLDGVAVAVDGSKTVAVTATKTYTLTVANASGTDTCTAHVTVATPTPLPTCDSFTATPTSLPVGGGNVTLAWQTTNATSVKLDGTAVSVDGSKVVNVTATKTFTLTVEGTNGSDSCTAHVTVATTTPLPTCDSFTANPTSLPIGGGNTTLTWATTNATSVKLDGVAVAVDGSKTVAVTATKTFTLTVDGTNGTDSCTATVTVATDNGSAPSCDAFSASPTSLPIGGGNTTLTWATTNADTVSIDNGIGEVAADGSKVVSVTSSKTFTLTVSNAYGTNTCTAKVTVATYSGGGGSSAPRCTLKVSDKSIKLGEEVTLTWTTTRVDEVTLKDDHGNILIDAGDDKDELDGSMTVRPTKDTEYTLIGERGSRDVDCSVEVNVENGFSISEVRNQLPVVAGISLSQVPYTGFEAGPVLTTIFYVLLTLWGLFVAYVIAVRRDVFGGVSFAGAHDHVAYTDVSSDAQTDISPAEQYVAAVTEPTTATAEAPVNLPTGIAPVVGYASREAVVMTDEEADLSIEMSELENRAHLQHTLFSSDAMRYFMRVTPTESRESGLDALIAHAKAAFPAEDGWLVINLARLETLLETDGAEEVVAATPVIPGNGGSLAEAIVTGNVVAAFQLIANRPMIALADAAAELDAVLRTRKGVSAVVSDMLTRETAALTDAQLQAAIVALTGALDGVYTTEEEAVKMAIMKAVKAVA